MDINMTLIGQTIAMVVFVWFCMKFIWPPIMTAIEERQTEIADGLAAAEKGQQYLDKATAEGADVVEDARKQATTIIDQAHAATTASRDCFDNHGKANLLGYLHGLGFILHRSVATGNDRHLCFLHGLSGQCLVPHPADGL